MFHFNRLLGIVYGVILVCTCWISIFILLTTPSHSQSHISTSVPVHVEVKLDVHSITSPARPPIQPYFLQESICTAYTVYHNQVLFDEKQLVVANTEIPGNEYVIFQYGDPSSIQQHLWWIQSVQSYAKQHGYAYTLQTIDANKSLNWINSFRRKCEFGAHHSSSKLQGLKPFAIHNFVGDFAKKRVMYLDLDVYIANPMLKLEEIMQDASRTMNPREHRKCFLVAQDGRYDINTGFLMFSFVEFEHQLRFKALVNNWVRHWLELAGVWDGDQIAFEYAIMNEAQIWSGTPLTRFSNCSYQDAHGARLCFNTNMQNSHASYGHRVFGDYCIVPEVRGRARLNFHTQYRKGDFLFHGKEESQFIHQQQ